MSHRVEQLNELLKHAVAEILQREVEMPADVFLTITKATVTPDLSMAKVWASVMPAGKGEETIKDLNRKKKYVAHLIGQKTMIRKLPNIDFVLDTTEAEAETIEKLFEE